MSLRSALRGSGSERRWPMRKPGAILSLLLIGLLTLPGATGPGLALTSAEAVDQVNAYPNVGTIMVWRDPNNPLGLPGGLAGYVTAVLIHPQTTTHGGTLRRAKPTRPSALGSGSRQLCAECTRRVHLDRHQSRPRDVLCSSVLSAARALPRVARSTTSTGSTSPGSATWVCAFSTSRRSASARPSWRIAPWTTRVSPGRG